MTPELGNFCLTLALALALVQTVVPLWGASRNNAAMMAVAGPAAIAQFLAVLGAFGILTLAFIQNDFSVSYVAYNSNSALPLGYRIAAVWGAHEGSLVLWLLIQALWTIAVVFASRSLPVSLSARVIGVLGFVSVGFLLFTIFTSNPFLRLQPAPFDGADLNPLLQDPGLAIHPPILYLGYVGFSVAFAFAIAAMLAGKLDREWARWTRPWTTAAWAFLTVGIALGSWWAYYELGWGGWWFWDPVENASFMPWLVGTALMHSLAVTETRGLFKSWTLLLAIAAFSLSLLGTFLVRSGILVSVHSFASDPARGFYILAFLLVVIGGALTLYAIRAPQLDSEGGFKGLSRETFLLLNNVLLVVAAALVLFGTLAPLAYDALGLGKISVGPTVFEIAFMLPMLPLVFLVSIGMHTAWRQSDGARIRRLVTPPLVVAAVAALALPWLVFERPSVLTWIGLTAGFWVMLAALVVPLRAIRGRQTLGGRAGAGMHLAHFGLGLFVVGVTVVSAYSVETDQSLTVGSTVEVAGATFTLRDLRQVDGPNYQALEGEFEIRKDGKLIGLVAPQKRTYRVQKSPMTEAGIDANLSRDWFVALGDPLGNQAWSVRIQYKPMLRLIWLGTLVMALAGLLALSDRRYYRQRRAAKVGASSPASSQRPVDGKPAEAL